MCPSRQSLFTTEGASTTTYDRVGRQSPRSHHSTSTVHVKAAADRPLIPVQARSSAPPDLDACRHRKHRASPLGERTIHLFPTCPARRRIRFVRRCTRRLRELNPAIHCYSMQPDSPFNGLEGLKHMETAIVPPIYDAHLAERNIAMPTERAYRMAKRLATTGGLLLGVSAAAAVCASLDVAREEAKAGREAVIVTILCDSADKYLSERFWTEPTPDEAAADAIDSEQFAGQNA